MADRSSNSGIFLSALYAVIATLFTFFLLITYLAVDGRKISESRLVLCSAVLVLTFGIARGSIRINSLMSLAMIGIEHVFTSGYAILEPFIGDDFAVGFIFPVVFAFILTSPIPFLLSFKFFSAIFGAVFLINFALIRMSIPENGATRELIIKLKSLSAKVITEFYSLTHPFWDKLKYMWNLIYNPVIYALNFASAFVFREVISFASTGDWLITFALFLLGMFMTSRVIRMALHADAETYWRNSDLVKLFGRVYMVGGCLLLCLLLQMLWPIPSAILAMAAGAFLCEYANSVEDPPQCKEYSAMVRREKLAKAAAEYAREREEEEEEKKKKKNKHKPKAKKNF